jgi:prevent-host-death family protein
MAIVANIHEAKSTLSRLIERALSGEDVVIARNGRPVVRLEPITAVPAGRQGGRWSEGAREIDQDWWAPDARLTKLFEDGETLPSGKPE